MARGRLFGAPRGNLQASRAVRLITIECRSLLCLSTTKTACRVGEVLNHAWALASTSGRRSSAHPPAHDRDKQKRSQRAISSR